MGPAGLPSRALAARLGNRWTYAGDGVAPGQIPADRMLRDLQFRRIRPDATLYGVVGKPIGHSRSPIMHNAGFAALGLNAAYLPLEAADRRRLRLVREARWRCAARASRRRSRSRSWRRVDEIDPIARRVGAINTLVVRNGRWLGANTDVDGFLAPLTNRIPLRGLRASVLGAGGAARAVAVALAEAARTSRSPRGARTPPARSRISSAARTEVFPPPAGTWDVLVNTTPAAASPQAQARWGARRSTARIVYDLVYDPAETTAAARRACRGLPTRSAASRCSSRRRSGSSSSGPGSGRPRAFLRRPHDPPCQRSRPAAARVSRRIRYEADDVRRVQGAGAARHVRAGRARRSSPTC